MITPIELREYWRLRHLAWPERKNKAAKTWYWRNRDHKLQVARQWAKNNRARRNELDRLWRKRNPERHAQNQRRFQLRHPELFQRHAALRRARKRKTVIGDQSLIQKIYARAMQWRKWGFDVVVDHAIPLAKGGAHSVDNLQIIYADENRQKNARLDYLPQAIFL